LGIALKYTANETLMGYLYSIGQCNTTIGFIPFRLNEIYRPNLFYEKVFGRSEFLKNINTIEELYGTAFGLRTACQYGSIGVRAMEPKGLKEFMPTEKGAKKISYKENNEEQKIIIKLYLIWILAMLNNEKLWDISHEIAKQLISYKERAEKARANRISNIEILFASSRRQAFLKNLIPIIEDDKTINFEDLGKLVHFMPEDNFPYFNVLIKFRYITLINNK
jgi:hypothetical protein